MKPERWQLLRSVQRSRSQPSGRAGDAESLARSQFLALSINWYVFWVSLQQEPPDVWKLPRHRRAAQSPGSVARELLDEDTRREGLGTRGSDWCDVRLRSFLQTEVGFGCGSCFSARPVVWLLRRLAHDKFWIVRMILPHVQLQTLQYNLSFH